MKATKFTLDMALEVLHKDSIPNMIQQALAQILAEVAEGSLRFEDGDEVAWAITQKDVEF